MKSRIKLILAMYMLINFMLGFNHKSCAEHYEVMGKHYVCTLFFSIVYHSNMIFWHIY